MIGVEIDIGPNLLAAVSIICSAVAALYARKATKEQRPNGGSSQRDAINRTEATMHAVAESLGVPHPPPGTPTGPVAVVVAEPSSEGV